MAQKDVGNKVPIYKLKETKEVMDFYDEWGLDNKYDKDMVEWNYTGPKETVEVFKKHQKEKDINIYDAGCGTGLVGVELKKYGFTNFFGADLLVRSWFVKYDKNAFQELHSHGGTILTQVYFVKVPKDLKFIGTQPQRHEGSLVISNTKTDWDGLRTAYIKPEEGKLVTFPAEYPHYTLPIVSDDERYVIVQDIYGKKI